MKAIISLLLLSWTTSAWFSGPYGKAFLDFPLFLVNPLIPFIATILWSLFIFIIWLRRQGNIIRMRIIQCLNQKRKTVFLLCGILAFNLIVIQGHSILNYFGDHDSDSALQGIVGYHIAEGIERPMYVYGWHYVGSIQMHITAIFNWAFGKNPFYKRAIGSIFYSGFLLGFFIFVYRLFKKKTALIATFIAAIPPFSVAAQLRYDEFIGLSFWGIIGLNLLLSITHSKKDKWNYYFWYGFEIKAF